MKPKLISADLDGTLLDNDKNLSAFNKKALERAAAAGAEIVIATGRPFAGIPRALLEMPLFRYFILLNGAKVYDRKLDRALYRAEIPVETAVRIFDMADDARAMVSCFQNDVGLTERKYFDAIDCYIHDPPSNKLIRSLRIPVDNLRDYVLSRGGTVQKIQFFFQNLSRREKLKLLIDRNFPQLAASVSMPENLEINHCDATKGKALKALCGELLINMEETAAFGDGTNDISMLKDAGIGVAMANADPSVLECADMMTSAGCEDGVGKTLDMWYAG